MSEKGLLVGAELSSLFSTSQAASVVIQTQRQDTPLSSDTVSLPEHATHASLLHTPSTGTILLRVLHGGLIIQLVSLSTDVPPLQFVFPSPVLPSPAIFLWESNELHLLAVTVSGSVYRLVVPIRDGMHLWRDNSGSVWTREYLIQSYSGPMEGLVHVQGTHCVVVGLPSGSLMRLDADYLGNEGSEDEWQESTFHPHNSFLSSLTSFLSTRNANPDPEIISIATHPWPTDVGHVFTLSRDRVLKFWKPKLGCVSIKSLDPTENSSSPGSSRASPGLLPKLLLPGEKQTLLRVFSVPSSTEQDDVYVLVFIPTPLLPSSGGTFSIFDIQDDQFNEVATFSCSSTSARCALQDFMIMPGALGKPPTLYTLWERDGRSVVEWKSMKKVSSVTDSDDDEEQGLDFWHSASYAPEPELTPSFLEEVLLNPGSLSEKFFELIMRPGMFSPLTLRTALDQYINACLSLPSSSFQSHIFPPSSSAIGSSVPPALTQTHPTLGEHIAAVVGCTVTLNVNPTTGEVEHAKYWTALRRDWEGFVARCREIERSARAPLVLGAIAAPGSTSPANGDGIVVIVIEKERAGILGKEDLPIGVWRNVASGTQRMFHPLLQSLHTLRTHLYNESPQTARELESRFVDIMHQETAFGFRDIVRDLVGRVGGKILQNVCEREAEASAILDNLRTALGVGTDTVATVTLDEALRAAFDVIGGFDAEVKMEEEEDDVERLLSPLALSNPSASDSSADNLPSQWDRALTSAYIVTTTNARYELCVSLVMLFYFLFADLSGSGEEQEEYDDEEETSWEMVNEALLAEVFAVFRGVAMLRSVVRQPGGRQPVDSVANIDGPPAGRPDDDVVSLMRNMNVRAENRSSGYTLSPPVSLLRILIAQNPLASASPVTDHNSGPDLPAAAHRFLDATGLLQSISPACATPHEIAFCENLRQLRYHDLAREVLSWLPRTPGVTYVLARLWLDMGRADDAAYLFEKLAGSFGPDNGLSMQDSTALSRVLGAGRMIESSGEFYVHVASLFKGRAYVQHEVQFTQLAISVAPPGCDTSLLWQTVIKGYTDLGWYEEAYAAWVAAPYDSLKQDSLGALVYRLCEDNAIDQLTSFNFAGFSDEVEATIAFKARNVDPTVGTNYSRILYSWYTLRGDYRNAALAMYQRARRLHDLVLNKPSLMTALAPQELEAYMIAMNSLSLVDPKNAWILLRGSVESVHQPAKRARTSKYIPESKFSPGKYDAEIVHLADIQYDYTLLSAQVRLLQRDPSLQLSSEIFLPPLSVVLRLAQSNEFDLAMATARSLKVDMTDLFVRLTTQCLRLSQDPETIMQEESSYWLLTDKVSSWPGSPADRGWRYLRQSLERHDDHETDFAYTKVAFETVMMYQRSPPPPWLIQALEKHHHEYLIRSSLRYDSMDRAIEYTLSLIRKADTRIAREPPKHAGATWLPYTLIDQVLAAAMSREPMPARLSELRTEVANSLKRMQNITLVATS
ncbi:nucleoporin Nup120/160-domain-containing protein [Mycena floridula]|nr:nucleoporin Nup120/160-domain-containing protein [Mycena floridula]